MYNTTTGTSITLLITLLFQLVVYERISWYPNWSSAGCSLHDARSAYPAYKIHSYKHLNILVMLLFTCKVASGSAVVTLRRLLIFSFEQSVIKQGCWCWALYRIIRTVKSSTRTGVFIIRLCLHSQENLSLLSSCF